MKRMLLGIAVLALLWPASPASAKDYSFPEVRIEATVLPDGTLELVERRTFAFDGDFSFAFFTIDDHDRFLIEDFTVTRDGQPLDVEEGVSPEGGFKGTWYFSAADQDVTFEISYRARCAVDVYQDTAHLLWQFVGTGWEKEAEHVVVTLRVPERVTQPVERPAAPCGAFAIPPLSGEEPVDPDRLQTEPLSRGDVRAWGHGPLGGEVRIADTQTVTFEVNDLPPFTFVEGSVLMPLESVPLAYQQPGSRRAQILAEEGALAEEANRLRSRYLGAQRTGRTLVWAVPAALLLLVFLARWRDRVPGVPRFLQEPPDERHPAELAYIWAAITRRSPTEAAYRTQLLQLAKEGAIEIEAVGRVTKPDDFTIRHKKEPIAPLDQEFMDFLFPDGKKHEQVRLKSVKPTGKRATELRQWTKQVTERGKQNVAKLVRKGIRLETWLLVAVAFGSAVWARASGGASIPELLFVGMGGIVAGLVVIGVPAFLRNLFIGIIVVVVAGLFALPIFLPLWGVLQETGVDFTVVHAAVFAAFAAWIVGLRLIGERYPADLRADIARWRSFRRFLKGFSSLPEAPTMAVVVWEQYMVYATALGVAGEVEKQVKALIPPEELVSPFAGAPSGLEGISLYHAFSSRPIAASAYTEYVRSSSSFSSGSGSFSSGGGFGGGFSGGGGGGGGGTGGGAG